VRRDPARTVAFEVLRAVDERDAYANLVLPGALRERRLTGRDAALATELTYGTLRGLGTYDEIIGACLDRALEDLDAPVRDTLRLGAHQLLATRIPAHAAVATTVDLTRAEVGPGPAKLVNAVLRRIGANDFGGWVERLAPAASTDPVERLALEHAHPAWIARAFSDALGGDLDEVAACLAANNARPAVTLVARPGRSEVGELEAAGATPARWSPYGAVLAEGDPGEIPAVRDGRAGVQDEGSQLVAVALAEAALGSGADSEWLDLCAGPGGKAALLAGLAVQRDTRLIAIEQHAHRATLVEKALDGAPGEHQVIVADGRIFAAEHADRFDRVLLDAPCTGLGALRRRPEARWRRQPSDVPALRKLQGELLAAALEGVRPGGVVGYITCSPHLAETATVVNGVLRGRADVERVDARPLLPGVPDLGDGPDVQLWPHRHGTDAMYLALLRRR
jgi:16S rRNA (cytosine967-C5)-methyltransferase